MAWNGSGYGLVWSDGRDGNLEIYFSRGYAKVTLAVARGRKLHDKREELKRRQQDREARRAIEAH